MVAFWLEEELIDPPTGPGAVGGTDVRDARLRRQRRAARREAVLGRTSSGTPGDADAGGYGVSERSGIVRGDVAPPFGSEDSLAEANLIINFEERLHPRDFRGRFADKIGKLTPRGTAGPDAALLPDGTRVVAHGQGGFAVHRSGRITRHSSAVEAAGEALDRSARGREPESYGGAMRHRSAEEAHAAIERGGIPRAGDIPVPRRRLVTRLAGDDPGERYRRLSVMTPEQRAEIQRDARGMGFQDVAAHAGDVSRERGASGRSPEDARRERGYQRDAAIAAAQASAVRGLTGSSNRGPGPEGPTGGRRVSTAGVPSARERGRIRSEAGAEGRAASLRNRGPGPEGPEAGGARVKTSDLAPGTIIAHGGGRAIFVEYHADTRLMGVRRIIGTTGRPSGTVSYYGASADAQHETFGRHASAGSTGSGNRGPGPEGPVGEEPRAGAPDFSKPATAHKVRDAKDYNDQRVQRYEVRVGGRKIGNVEKVQYRQQIRGRVGNIAVGSRNVTEWRIVDDRGGKVFQYQAASSKARAVEELVSRSKGAHGEAWDQAHAGLSAAEQRRAAATDPRQQTVLAGGVVDQRRRIDELRKLRRLAGTEDAPARSASGSSSTNRGPGPGGPEADTHGSPILDRMLGTPSQRAERERAQAAEPLPERARDAAVAVKAIGRSAGASVAREQPNYPHRGGTRITFDRPVSSPRGSAEVWDVDSRGKVTPVTPGGVGASSTYSVEALRTHARGRAARRIAVRVRRGLRAGRAVRTSTRSIGRTRTSRRLARPGGGSARVTSWIGTRGRARSRGLSRGLRAGRTSRGVRRRRRRGALRRGTSRRRRRIGGGRGAGTS
jgi:hypothetical protein